MHSIRRDKIDASGNEFRNTTLRDARELGLFPSVTGILGIFAKPGLDKWRLNQVALAALKIQKQEQESTAYWTERVKDEAFRQVDEAADLGSAIHGAMESVIEHGDMSGIDTELVPYVKPALAWFTGKNITIENKECIVVNRHHGFAGTTDVGGSFTAKGTHWKIIVDYKTRKTKPGVKVNPYDFQPEQIAAYAATIYPSEFEKELVWGINLYISSTEPGRIEYAKYAPKELRRYFETFSAACTIWRNLNDYDPRNWKPQIAPDGQSELPLTPSERASIPSPKLAEPYLPPVNYLQPDPMDPEGALPPGMARNPMDPQGAPIPSDVAAIIKGMPDHPQGQRGAYDDFLAGRSGPAGVKAEKQKAKLAQMELKKVPKLKKAVKAEAKAKAAPATVVKPKTRKAAK